MIGKLGLLCAATLALLNTASAEVVSSSYFANA
jgi:hypothetical protein